MTTQGQARRYAPALVDDEPCGPSYTEMMRTLTEAACHHPVDFDEKHRLESQAAGMCGVRLVRDVPGVVTTHEMYDELGRRAAAERAPGAPR